ncbi:MAG TPA: DEAD/DEAH box helicase [Candidatus Handelsmanbacteria bacterium]|nr:DEAD/DEAH box helicase [Candidatus Handelsmanbacteria bacterium]
MSALQGCWHGSEAGGRLSIVSQLTLFAPPVVTPQPTTFRSRIQPRDYQGRAVEKLFQLFADGIEGALCRSPTGTGKTITGSLAADKWLQQGDDYRVMVIAHERQLIWQFAEEIEDVLRISPGIEMADRGVQEWSMPKIVVASRATLQERTLLDDDGNELSRCRLRKFNPRLNWLVIWDEAHKHTYSLSSVRHIVDHFATNPQSKRMGLTATPERSDKRTLAKMFPGIALDYRLYDISGGPSAVGDGWAVEYDQRYIIVEGVDFKGLREVAGDFRDDDLELILSTEEQLAKLCEPMLDLVVDRRTIIFNPGVDMAKAVARYINAKAGATVAKSLDGAVPERDRKKTYADHQAGNFQFLSVCGLCREGYNDPGIQAVAVFRPTKSRTLAEQMKGRGCRPLRGLVNGLETAEERLKAIAASDKKACMVIDLVGMTGLGDCATTAHIYANSQPDEVIEDEVIALANERAVEKAKEGKLIDIAEEIEAAENDINERRAEKERREREAQAEADRRAKLRASVQYHECAVNSGHGGAGRIGRADRVVSFGKYKGMKYQDVPGSYLRWCCANLSVLFLRVACKNELNRREIK